MQLTIRVLQDKKDISIEVDGTITVNQLKDEVEKQTDIPSARQRLLCKGPLADGDRLCDIPLCDGDKVFLATIAKKEEGGPQSPFWRKLRTFLRKHFSQPDAEKVLECMREELRRCIYSTNLDTLELIATECLKGSHTPAATGSSS